MGLGGSIFLIALGALLAFAVDYQLYWLDLTAACPSASPNPAPATH